VKSETTTVEPVHMVELRLERRRAKLLRDWGETRAYVARQNRWTPLAIVAGVAALGFGLARQRPASSFAATRRVGAGQRGVFAALAAMIGGGIRFALSPAGRALWTSWNRGTSRPR